MLHPGDCWHFMLHPGDCWHFMHLSGCSADFVHRLMRFYPLARALVYAQFTYNAVSTKYLLSASIL